MTEYVELTVSKKNLNLRVTLPPMGDSVTVNPGDDTYIARNGDTYIARNGDTYVAHGSATVTPQILWVSKRTFRFLVEAVNG